MGDFTISELKLLARGNVSMETSLGLITATKADDILALINPAIDYILQEFSRTPKERQNRSEDGLSIDLVTSLKHLGFQASHDTTVGGHCDIVIDGKFNFLWLGEAKIHNGYEWLLKGFNQLDSRYATAIAGQDHGGVVIYHYGKRSDTVMDSWARYLKDKRPDVEIEARNVGDLEMRTRHIHTRTGHHYHVRHVIVSLHWNPKD